MSATMRHALVLACLVGVLLSGCVAVSNGGGGHDANATAIASHVEQRIDSTHSLEATLIATTEVGNTTVTEHVRLRYERPRHYNITWLKATNSSGAVLRNATGDRMIANGSQLWAYDDATRRVTWMNATRPRNLTQLLMPSTQFGRNVTFVGNESVAGTGAVKLSYAIDGSKLSLIAGDSHERSRLRSKMNASTPVEATVWIDRDRWLPIKTRLTVSAFEDNVTMTYRYEDIHRNVSIPAGSFERPANATRATPWQNIEDHFGEYQSVSALRADLDTPVAEPTVPDGFRFEWGNVTTIHGTQRVVLFYGQGATKLQLTRWDNASLDPLKGGKQVPVGSTNGTLVLLSQSQLVEWHCEDYTYLVSTRAGREAALAAARSVGC